MCWSLLILAVCVCVCVFVVVSAFCFCLSPWWTLETAAALFSPYLHLEMMWMRLFHDGKGVSRFETKRKHPFWWFLAHQWWFCNKNCYKHLFPKLKKHSPTNVYMLYPMVQSVALVCVEIDKKLTLQRQCPLSSPKSFWCAASTPQRADRGPFDFTNTPACQQEALPARYRRTASLSTYTHSKESSERSPIPRSQREARSSVLFRDATFEIQQRVPHSETVHFRGALSHVTEKDYVMYGTIVDAEKHNIMRTFMREKGSSLSPQIRTSP